MLLCPRDQWTAPRYRWALTPPPLGFRFCACPQTAQNRWSLRQAKGHMASNGCHRGGCQKFVHGGERELTPLLCRFDSRESEAFRGLLIKAAACLRPLKCSTPRPARGPPKGRKDNESSFTGWPVDMSTPRTPSRASALSSDDEDAEEPPEEEATAGCSTSLKIVVVCCIWSLTIPY